MIEQHGYGRTFAAGLRTLGYPGTWAHTHKEIDQLQEALSHGI